MFGRVLGWAALGWFAGFVGFVLFGMLADSDSKIQYFRELPVSVPVAWGVLAALYVAAWFTWQSVLDWHYGQK